MHNQAVLLLYLVMPFLPCSFPGVTQHQRVVTEEQGSHQAVVDLLQKSNLSCSVSSFKQRRLQVE